jgi:hypothetical protein
MKSNFVPYQIALDMKSIEFDEPCFGYYTGDKMHLVIRPAMSRTNIPDSYVVTAPLYQQAFRWFREKHKSKFILSEDYYWIIGIGQIKVNSYEEAELECLKKLIEIVKEK